MKSKILAALFVPALVALALSCSSCASMQYGDGKAGNVSLSPAVEKLATALDSKVPGAGAMIRKYFAEASRQRVPQGWEMVMKVKHRVTGVAIDLADYELVPEMRRATGSAASGEAALLDLLNGSTATNAAVSDLIGILNGQTSGGGAP